MVSSLPRVSLIVALMVVISTACSDNAHNKMSDGATPAASNVSGIDNFKKYEPASLVEVKAFADLPDGVKNLANMDGMDARGEGPDGRLRRFMVGGTSQTSALLAYEQFGFVPTYVAVAYVYAGSHWIAVRRWDISKVTTLQEALNVTTP